MSHGKIRYALPLAAMLVALPAAAQEVAPLLEQARTGDAAAQQAARESLVGLGAKVIPGLFQRLATTAGADDIVAQNVAYFAVQSAARPGNESERAAMAGALLAEVAGNRSLAARRYALELVSFVAASTEASALGKLLADPDLGEMSLWALKRVPGPEATAALVSAARSSTGDLRIGVIQALASRGPSGIPALKNALASGEERVRIAARQSLATIPEPSLEGVLRSGLASGSEREQTNATDAYLALADTLLPFRGAAAARARRTAETIYRWAADRGPDARTRVAGLLGLTSLGPREAFPSLLTSLQSEDGAVREGAIAGLEAVPDATALIVKAIPKSKLEQRVALVRILGRRGQRDATGSLVLLLQNEDDATASAALQALGDLRDPAAASVLLGATEVGPPQNRPVALRAFMNTLDAGKDPARTQTAYEHALQIATRDEERRIALQGLAGMGRPSSQAIVEPYLNSSLRGEASAVLAAIGDRFMAVGEKAQAVPLYRRALEAATDPGLRRRLGGRLRQAGVEIDLTADGGFITRWQALGPLPGRERWTKEDAFNPAMPLDTTKAIAVDGQSLNWKPATVSDPDGMLDLEQAVAQRGDAVAYLYAEVTSPTEQDVLLKIGSDDGFVVWVNGERKGEVLADRPYVPDQDSVKAHLKPGANTLLVKVTQGGGQWAASLRVTTPAGAPIRLEQGK